MDDVSTDYAIAWLKQNHAKPFSMVFGFKSPHSPRGGKNLPERLRNTYAGETSRSTPNMGVQPIYRTPSRPILEPPSGGPVAANLESNSLSGALKEWTPVENPEDDPDWFDQSNPWRPREILQDDRILVLDAD